MRRAPQAWRCWRWKPSPCSSRGTSNVAGSESNCGLGAWTKAGERGTPWLAGARRWGCTDTLRPASTAEAPADLRALQPACPRAGTQQWERCEEGRARRPLGAGELKRAGLRVGVREAGGWEQCARGWRWGWEVGSSGPGWGCSAQPGALPAAASCGPAAGALCTQGRCCSAADAASCRGRNSARLS